VSAPDREMMAVAEKLAGFIAGRGEHLPSDLFAASGVVIVENFAPFIFRDVSRWAEAMRAHLKDLADLRHDFGAPHDFSCDGDTAYFALPTIWSGLSCDVPFRETGGWALVLKREAEEWRLAGYGWAVVESTVAGLPPQ
jgi:hypothetical protein